MRRARSKHAPLARPIAARRRARRALAAAALAIAAALTAGLALANGTVPAPTLTTKPANPTKQTSAQFTYSDTQAGVSFQCSLDGSTFASCPANGITYPGPLADGAHTFKVQAVSSAGKTSETTIYKWTIDTAAPAITLSFPKNGTAYGEAAWSTGCAAAPGICGNAKDATAVASVLVSVEQVSTGRWWSGTGFEKTSEYFRAATLASPGAASTTWSYPFAFPPEGSYVVHVRASDGVSNTTTEASQTSATFSIDVPPPTPVISSGPEAHTTSTSATFTFSDAEEGVSLLCRLDGGSFAKCASPKTYTGLAAGAHTFYVEAKDPVGNISSASYAWAVETSGKAFTIEGGIVGALAPGVSQPLPLTITNPNSVAINVTSILVSVRAGSSNAGCDGPTNLQVTQSNATSTKPLVVAGGGHVTLPSGSVTAPQVLMLNLATNQDACKGAVFNFNYSGSAHS
jgi:hypothetical protein